MRVLFDKESRTVSITYDEGEFAEAHGYAGVGELRDVYGTFERALCSRITDDFADISASPVAHNMRCETCDGRIDCLVRAKITGL